MTSTAASAARAAPADRRGRPPPGRGVPGHLDLEDPVPRGRGPARAAADAGRLPALQRGRPRAAAEDPAAAARRVPAAARDQGRAGCARARRSGSASGRPRSAREEEAITLDELCDRSGCHPSSRRSSRTSGCSRRRQRGREALSRDRRGRRRDVCAADALRRRAAATCGPSGPRPGARRHCSSSSSRRRCAAATPSGARRRSVTCTQLAELASELSSLLFWRDLRDLAQ